MATRSGTNRDVTPADRPAGVRRFSDAFVVVGVGVGFVLIVVLLAWVANGGNDRTRPSLVAAETSAPMREAERWLAANLRGERRIVIDRAAASELAAEGI